MRSRCLNGLRGSTTRFIPGQDYAAETQRLTEVIATHKRAPGNTLLDVACGTGGHIPYLKDRFEIEGLDLNEVFLDIARERNPEVTFHLGDMIETDLGRQFDVVTCLFSAIGYVKTAERMAAAVANMARHVAPGGVLIVEPWFSPQTWKGGRRAPRHRYGRRARLQGRER